MVTFSLVSEVNTKLPDYSNVKRRTEKGKVVTGQAMKICSGRRSVSALLLTLDIG
jgi:hypothetical protein